MSHQLFFDEQPTALVPSVPLQDFLYQKITARRSPFIPLRFYKKAVWQIVRSVVVAMERIFGTTLYVENELRELFAMDASSRNLVVRLLDEGIITAWHNVPVRPDCPRVAIARLDFGNITNSSGKRARFQFGSSEGAGETLNSAFPPALGEILERHSLVTWKKKNIIHGTFRSLRLRGAVSPSLLVPYSKKQLTEDLSHLNHVSDATEMDWVKGRSFTTGKRVLVPAQAVYFNYAHDEEGGEYPLAVPSSNGAAAGSRYEDALYRALCEAIERDGLYLYWLNKIAPPKVDPASVPNEKVQDMLKELSRYDLSIHILDITTDLDVPAFCGIVIDTKGGRAVSLGSAAGFNGIYALEKLFYEVAKALHADSATNEPPPYRGKSGHFGDVDTLGKRGVFWSNANMIPNIEFFLKGKIKKFSEIKNPCENAKTRERLSYLRNKFIQKKYQGYTIDVTSDEARHAGLTVVKTILPDFIPFSPNEARRGLGLRRLYETPVVLGLRARAISEHEINNIPTPLI